VRPVIQSNRFTSTEGLHQGPQAGRAPGLLPVLILTLALLPVPAARNVLAAEANQPRPGQYEVTIHTTYSELPIPETTVTTTSCLTQEILDQDPSSAFAGLPAENLCELNEFQMASGAISMTVTCTAEDGGLRMITWGSFDDSGYQMTTEVTVDADPGKALLRADTQAVRLGDC
jgi:hypothetical protein